MLICFICNSTYGVSW